MSDTARIVECLIHATADLRLLRVSMPDRRERIATAALKGLLAQGQYWAPHKAAYEAVDYADALIDELDKPQQVKP